MPSEPASPLPKTEPLPSPVPLLERTLGPDWRCLTEAEIRVDGESGPVDLVALHPRHGVVLVALLHEDEAASPEAAAAAFRAMARELGFAGRFPGELKVAAVAHQLAGRDRLAEAIREAAGQAPESPPDAAWVEWLCPQLAPQSGPQPCLVVPPAADEPPQPATRLAAPGERLVPGPPPRPASDKTMRLTLAAAVILLAVLGLVARVAVG